MQYDTFSQYHPLVNFIFFIGAIGSCVLIQHPAYLIASIVAALAYYCLLRGKKSLLLGVLFILVAVINPLFNTDGKTVLFYLFDRPYTFEALCYGFATACILLGTILWFGCYNRVMTSDKFTALFGNLSLSLLIVMILRMIPSLSKKTKQIANARMCIGKGTSEKASLRHKIKSGTTVLSAVTDHALEGSVITADSMRARGYGCGKRTSFQIYRMLLRDYLLLFLQIILLTLVIVLGKMGVSYTPTLQVQNVSWGFAAYCIYLLIPVILHAKEAIQWRISRSKI